MSQNPSMSVLPELDQRLSRLERENRRLRMSAALTGVLFAVAFAVLFYGPRFTRDSDRIYRGSMFVLADKDDRTSGAMYVIEDSRPQFFLGDRNKETRMVLSINQNDDPEIHLVDKDRKTRIRLFLAEDGSPYLLNRTG